MSRKRDRRRDNPGRPISIGADARLELRLPGALIEQTRAAARRDGVSASEWWRRAASAALTAASQAYADSLHGRSG